MINLIRISTPHLDTIFQITLFMSNSHSTMKMMAIDREGGAEVEAGGMETEMSMGILEAPGKDPEESLVDTAVTTKENGPLVQVCLAGMEPVVLTGEEMKKRISNKPVRSRMLKLKLPGTLTLSIEDSSTMK